MRTVPICFLSTRTLWRTLLVLPLMLAAILGAAAQSGTPQQEDGPEKVLVRGKVVLEGEVPEAGILSMRADPKCAEFTNKDESLQVSDGGLNNVIVFVNL